MKIGLDLAEISRISKLDWHDGEGKEKGREEEGEESYFVILKNVYLFVCLFVCLLFNCLFFYFNHLRTPKGIYPENFARI